jgi:hypothetical protein
MFRSSWRRSTAWEGLCLNPPKSAVVLNVDEKTQVQALARSRPALPMMPGTRHPQPGQSMEREPQTLHLDQDRRTDPGVNRTTSEGDFRRRTLAGHF